MPDAAIDACCLIDLVASGDAEAILRASGFRWYLPSAVRSEVQYRRQHDPATRHYIARRISEGKTSRDAVRLLKRYLARHLYRLMQNTSPAMT